MSEATQPVHHLARDYLERRTPVLDTLPMREVVRRELGWALIAAECQAQT